MQESEIRERLALVARQAEADPEFRERLLMNPEIGKLESAGAILPPGPETDRIREVLAALARERAERTGGELNDAELESVAGGGMLQWLEDFFKWLEDQFQAHAFGNQFTPVG